MCEYCEESMKVIGTATSANILEWQVIKAATTIDSKYNEDGDREYFLNTIMYYYTPKGYVGIGDDTNTKINFCPFCGRKFG